MLRFLTTAVMGYALLQINLMKIRVHRHNRITPRKNRHLFREGLMDFFKSRLLFSGTDCKAGGSKGVGIKGFRFGAKPVELLQFGSVFLLKYGFSLSVMPGCCVGSGKRPGNILSCLLRDRAAFLSLPFVVSIPLSYSSLRGSEGAVAIRTVSRRSWPDANHRPAHFAKPAGGRFGKQVGCISNGKTDCHDQPAGWSCNDGNAARRGREVPRPHRPSFSAENEIRLAERTARLGGYHPVGIPPPPKCCAFQRW